MEGARLRGTPPKAATTIVVAAPAEGRDGGLEGYLSQGGETITILDFLTIGSLIFAVLKRTFKNKKSDKVRNKSCVPEKKKAFS